MGHAGDSRSSRGSRGARRSRCRGWAQPSSSPSTCRRRTRLFQLWLDAREGFYFSDRITGAWSRATDRRGTHGFVPTRPELHAALILAGPGFEKRGDLGVVPMTRIAPTVATHLGIELSTKAAAALQ